MAPLTQGAKMRKSTEKRTEKKITKKVTKKTVGVVGPAKKRAVKRSAKAIDQELFTKFVHDNHDAIVAALKKIIEKPEPSQNVYTCICCGKIGIMIIPPVKCKNCDAVKSYVIRTDLKVPESYEE